MCENLSYPLGRHQVHGKAMAAVFIVKTGGAGVAGGAGGGGGAAAGMQGAGDALEREEYR